MTGALLSTGPAGRRGLGGGAAPGGTAATGGEPLPPQPPPKALELLSPLLKPQLSNPLWLLLQAEAGTKHVWPERGLIWLGRAQAGSAEGGGQLRAERARLPRPRGFARSLHCSDQGRGSCHSQAVLVLPGRKCQDGDLGAAPVLSTLWQRRGTAGRPQAPAFRLLPVPRAPWFPSIRERSCLVWKPAPNDLPAPLGKSAPHTC